MFRGRTPDPPLKGNEPMREMFRMGDGGTRKEGEGGEPGSLGRDAAEKNSAVAHELPSNIYVSALTKHSCLLDSTV